MVCQQVLLLNGASVIDSPIHIINLFLHLGCVLDQMKTVIVVVNFVLRHFSAQMVI